MQKLKQTEIKEYRDKLLQENNICPLCGTEILPEEAALDHDHFSGLIRGVLHKSCNSAEGRILSWAKRSRSTDPLDFIENLVLYWTKDYTGNPVHPSHKSPKEQQISLLKRRMKKLKTKRGKDNIRKQIKELQDGRD